MPIGVGETKGAARKHERKCCARKVDAREKEN